jgi:hypothetical protein
VGAVDDTVAVDTVGRGGSGTVTVVVAVHVETVTLLADGDVV